MTTNADHGFIPEITVAWRIKIARAYAGMEQDELAAATQIAINTISNYERGVTTRVKPLYLKQIAMATGVNVHWLITGEGTPGGDGGIDVSASSHPSQWPHESRTLSIVGGRLAS